MCVLLNMVYTYDFICCSCFVLQLNRLSFSLYPSLSLFFPLFPEHKTTTRIHKQKNNNKWWWYLPLGTFNNNNSASVGVFGKNSPPHDNGVGRCAPLSARPGRAIKSFAFDMCGEVMSSAISDRVLRCMSGCVFSLWR